MLTYKRVLIYWLLLILNMDHCKMLGKRHNTDRCHCDVKARLVEQAFNQKERAIIASLNATSKVRIACRQWFDFKMIYIMPNRAVYPKNR